MSHYTVFYLATYVGTVWAWNAADAIEHYRGIENRNEPHWNAYETEPGN